MKLNKVKNMWRILSVIALLGSTLCTSCISEDINRNPLLPTKEDEKMDGVIYGAYLPNLEKSVIPIGTASESTEPVNRYQIGVNLAGDAWAGYMSPRDNKFNGSKNFTNYFMYENWVNYVYSFMVTDVYSPWMQIKRISQDEGTRNDEIYALAQIIKIAALHRTTDMFGPIPYSQVGKGSFKVAYDSQESVYRSFLKELEEAVQTLDDYSNKSKEVLPAFDIVYNGDVNKWMRFANSLMLRLAIRVRFADAGLAKEYAEKAVKHPAGLIDSKELAAQMGKGAGLQMKNPLKVINEEYNDTRMGATIYSYLAGYNDARAAVYFVKNNGFKAVRCGIAKSGDAFMVTDVYSPWMQIKRISQDEGTRNDEIYALAQIIKIAALHRTTDMFGPIPYSQVGKGSFKVAYDSQESVYRSFLKELEEAVQTLDDYSNKSKEVLPAFDIVYNGDVNKWMRFANSLMLRLAIRVRFADAGLAKEYAEKAVKHPAGLIDSKELAAQMGKGAGLQMKNPLKVINEEYNDTRMGATIYSYLAGYNDARAAVYFVKNNGFKAVRCGIAKSGDAYNGFTRPNVHEDDPLYWMKASEVCFLKAEGALAGFDMGGSAGDFYNAGIRMSFSENGLDNSSAETYLKDSTRKPANYTDTSNGELSANAPSSITIRWENGATEEEKLERIITQKYLAIFPNGQEAWTEWRRTGYPRQIVVAENKTNSAVLIGNGYDLGGVRRLPYPRTEYEQNGENLHNAISQYLGGVDNAATKVWWDKKSK